MRSAAGGRFCGICLLAGISRLCERSFASGQIEPFDFRGAGLRRTMPRSAFIKLPTGVSSVRIAPSTSFCPPDFGAGNLIKKMLIFAKFRL
ncbi:MAG: hypothetical protein DBX55_07575 [Verrucomicrobia bacterium]|nr:MAG: hypothetical protein DBX55_07575 [Verrucomicrobiota bacterium]